MAKDSGREQTWWNLWQSPEQRLLLANFLQSRTLQQDTVPFMLNVKSLQGLSLRQIALAGIDSRRASSRDGRAQQSCQVQVSISLFNDSCSQFVGRTWQSSPVSWEDQAMPLQQMVVFHCPADNTSLYAVLELLLISPTSTVCIGWSYLRLFQSRNLSQLPPGTTISKLRVYHGSPRCLLFLDKPFEDDKRLLSRVGTQLHCELTLHSNLDQATALLAPNAIYSIHTLVPGINMGNSLSAPLLRPRLASPVAAVLDKVVFRLPQLEVFEDDLSQLVTKKFSKDNGALHRVAKISERRLLVGVHNGHAFVRPLQIAFLNVHGLDRRNSIRGKRDSVRSTSGPVGLRLPGQLQVAGFVEDKNFVLVFFLEYILTVSMATGTQQTSVNSQSVPALQTHSVTIGWCVWSPLTTPPPPASTEQMHVRLELDVGPGKNPANHLLLSNNISRNNTATAQSRFLWSFEFYFAHRSRSQQPSFPSASPTSQMLTSEFQSLQTREATNSSEQDSLGLTAQLQQAKTVDSRTAAEQPTETLKHSAEREEQQSAELLTSHHGNALALPMAMAAQPSERLTEGKPLAVTDAVSGRPVGDVDSMPVLLHSVPSAALPLINTESQPNPVSHTSLPSTTLPRSVIAILHSVSLPSIVDMSGQPAVEVDPLTVLPINSQLELEDSLQTNEIVFQFIALGKVKMVSSSVFLTFQFYRFPQITTERLELVEANGVRGVYLLRKTTKARSEHSAIFGVEVRFPVDSDFSVFDENANLVKFLQYSSASVEIRDGLSLMLLGTATIPLRHLLRQGKVSVQSFHSLEVILHDDDQETVMVGDLTHHGSVRPVASQLRVNGMLYVRTGNIGSPAQSGVGRKTATHSCVVSRAGNFTAKNLSENQSRSRARLMVERNRELRQLLGLSANNKKQFSSEQENRQEARERQLKLERMKAVRQSRGDSVDHAIFQTKLSMDKAKRSRQLRTTELYRSRQKVEVLRDWRSHDITFSHNVYPALGTAYLIEFELKNPLTRSTTVHIEWQDKSLHLVTNSNEWRNLKEVFHVSTPLEEDMFQLSAAHTHAPPELFLRANETVFIPFKFHCIEQRDEEVCDTVKTNEAKMVAMSTMHSRTIKVLFRAEKQLLAVLQVHVHPQPHVVHQTLRFLHTENSVLKKCIRLPPWHKHSGTAADCLQAYSAHSGVVCQARQGDVGEPDHVYLKVTSGSAPNMQRFLVLLYGDPYLCLPLQIWQCVVHSFHRLDISSEVYQSSSVAVVLKGDRNNRQVQCFSSNPDLLQVSPSQPFTLLAHSVNELRLTLRPVTVTTLKVYLHVVDVISRQLVSAWLVYCHCVAPTVTKVTNIALPVGGGKQCNKRIHFTNPYSSRRRFGVTCSRPEMLQFKEQTFEVDGLHSHPVSLRFAPFPSPLETDVLVFINNEDGKNEECLCINVSYS